jgi:hypothetical protein
MIWTAFLILASLGLAADDHVVSLWIPETDPQPLAGSIVEEVRIHEGQSAYIQLTLTRTQQPQHTVSIVRLALIAPIAAWALAYF